MQRDWLVTTLIVALPDVALAWLYMKLVDGHAGDFWLALGVMYGVQTFFSIKNVLAGTLVFRLYGKRRFIAIAHDFFRQSNFPSPEPNENAHTYLLRISDAEDLPLVARKAAIAELARMRQVESQGFFVALRTGAAYDAAVSSFRP